MDQNNQDIKRLQEWQLGRNGKAVEGVETGTYRQSGFNCGDELYPEPARMRAAADGGSLHFNRKRRHQKPDDVPTFLSPLLAEEFKGLDVVMACSVFTPLYLLHSYLAQHAVASMLYIYLYFRIPRIHLFCALRARSGPSDVVYRVESVTSWV